MADKDPKKSLANSLALVKGAKEALERDDLPPEVRARLEKAMKIGEAGLKRELEKTGKPTGTDWDVIQKEAPRLSSSMHNVIDYIDAL